MDLTGSVIVWRDLTLYGRADAGRFSFFDWSGWEDLPDPRQDSLERPQAHGRFDAPVFGQERHVIVSGRCSSPAERDAMLIELQASFNFHAPDELPLTIAHAGRTLTAYARLLRFKPVSPDWGAGFIGWAAEWVCSDPLRYGAPVPVTTGFPVLTGGLEYDLFTDGTTPLVRTNLDTNPSFEVDLTDYAVTAGTETRDTAVEYSGAASLRFDTTVVDSRLYTVNGAVCSGSTTYTVSAYVKGTGSVEMKMAYRVGDVFFASSGVVALSGTWQRISATGVTGPSATTNTIHFYQRSSGVQTIWVDSILVEQSATPGTYFDGSSPGGAWTGTPNASTSTQTISVGTDTGFLEYGAASDTGRLLLANAGNEDVWPQFEIAGPIPVQGVEVVRVGTGERLRFEGGVSTGSVLVLDAATGLVVIDGYADRSGLLTIRDWTSVAPGGSAEFEFVPLGTFSAATLTATVSPGFW